MSYIKTTTGENTITFDAFYQYIWTRNYGETDVYISNHADIVAGDDDVALLPAGEAVRLTVNGNTLYVLGSTTLEVHAQNFSDSPFAWNEAGEGGGSEPVIESITINENGTYTAPSGVDGYSPVIVDTGIYTGTAEPSANLGKNGDYYYQREPLMQSSWSNEFKNYSFDDGYNYQGNKLHTNKDIVVKKMKVWMQSAFTTAFVILTLDDNNQWSVIYETAGQSPTTTAPFVYELIEPFTLKANTDYIIAAKMASGSFYYKPASTFTVNDGFTIESKAYTYNAHFDRHIWDFNANNYCFIDIEYDSGVELITNQYNKQSGLWVEIDA